MPKVPKIEESAFSANHYLIKWIVPRVHTSTLDQANHQYSIPKK